MVTVLILLLPFMLLSSEDSLNIDVHSWEWEEAEEITIDFIMPTSYIDEISSLKTNWGANAHLRLRRRYGVNTDELKNRYLGNPVGSYVGFSIYSGNVTVGGSVDKAPFEPDYTDLTRVWMKYENSNSTYIAGNYHILNGFGLTIATRPNMFQALDNPSRFRSSSYQIISASDNFQNGSIFGGAMKYYWGDTFLSMFAGNTPKDGIKDNQGDVLRLSSSGMHRTQGESVKHNSIYERIVGGAIGNSIKSDDWELSTTAIGYKLMYSSPLKPIVSESDRFPLSGQDFSAIGANASFKKNHFNSSIEIAIDDDFNTAFASTVSLNMTVNNRLNAFFEHIPLRFNNPYLREASSQRSNGSNTVGFHASSRVNMFHRTIINGHVETSERIWRSTIQPAPITVRKSSLEINPHFNRQFNASLLLKNSFNEEGSGFEGKMEQSEVRRYRIVLRYGEYKVVAEFGERNKLNHYSKSSLIGTSFRKVKQHGFGSLEVNGMLSLFNTTNSMPVYNGEAQLPDKLSSVYLAGYGLRWSGAITLKQSHKRHLGILLAKTERLDNSTPSDLEVYLTMIQRFRSN